VGGGTEVRPRIFPGATIERVTVPRHLELARRALRGYVPLTIEDGVERRRAAVMLLVHPLAGTDEILFQVRTQRVRFHKGEISLPGGGIDPGDTSPLHAALRETDEEIGVHPGHIEVLGALDQIATRSSNYLVTPFVGVVTAETPYPFALANREVAELLAIPIDHLRSDAAVRWSVSDLEGGTAEREFFFGEHRIWGATARILGGDEQIEVAAEAAGMAETAR
jgi:8-oxo-dGTP pyrophosphatase MutT (NUDIX family)